MRELQVLKVCLAEIDRSRPYLVVLLGDRYGWVPPEDRIAATAQEAGFTPDTVGKSVTALEIEFGILQKDPEQRRRCRFYFREPLPYDKMPAARAADYSDAHAIDPSARTAHEKLQRLKRRIEQDPELGPRVRHYHLGWDVRADRVTGLDAWGRQVLDDLWADLDEETRSAVEMPPAARRDEEDAAWDEFLQQKLRDFSGREALSDQLLQFALASAQHSATWGLCLTGKSGSGKSALLAHLHRRLQQHPVIVLGHAAGVTPRSAQVDAVLLRWIRQLAATVGERPTVDEAARPEELEQTFTSLLHRAATRQRVVLVLDALNQFDPTPRACHVSWLPVVWPENARLIATAIDGEESAALGRRPGARVEALPPLTETEAKAICHAVWHRYHRGLNAVVRDYVLAIRLPDGRPAFGNPLWLTLAMEHLNLLDADDFGRAGQDVQGLLLEKAAELPPDVEGLYALMLGRSEKVFGREWARPFAYLVALGRAGWRESDLRVLLPAAARLLCPDAPAVAWEPLRFAQVRRGFRAQLVQRASHGRWDYTHAQMRAALLRLPTPERTAGLADPALARRLHGLIADHLLDLGAEDPVRQSETMVHLIGADGRVRAAQYYGGALTDGEASGATEVLAGRLLASADGSFATLEWVASLPGQDALDDATRAGICNRFNFDLHDRLEREGALRVRRGVVEVARDALARLAQVDPTNAGWQRDLSVSQERIGDVLHAQGDLGGALAAYRQGLVIAERLAQADPTNAGRQRDLWVSHIKIGDVLRAQGDLGGARAVYRQGLAIVERLAQADPTNAEWQRDLSRGQERIGDVLRAQGDLGGARAAYRQGLVIVERLAQADPTNAGWQRDLSVSHTNIGDVLRAQGDLGGARAAYRQGLAIAERLAQADPTNAEWQRDLWVLCAKSAQTLQAAQDADALKWWRRAYEILSSMKRRGLFLSPSDEQVLAQLHQRFRT